MMHMEPDNRFTPEPPGVAFYLGLDLGRQRDYSALAIVERAVVPTDEFDHAKWQRITRAEFRLRHIGRMPLETPYTEVADRVCEQVRRSPLAGNATLAVDAAGVGLPVIDYLRAQRPPARLVPIVITGPGRVNSHNGVWTVPRADLIANLQVLVETNKLRVAAGTRDAAHLGAELSNFSDQRIGHDDLVFATALALFPAVRFRSKPAW